MKRVEEATVLPPPDKLVLYVEDEPTNWEVTELRLRSKFKMAWAKSDEEACAFVRLHGPRIHAVLMDVQLKGSVLDGIGLTRLFRGKLSGPQPDYTQGIAPLDCPIFFVTAFGHLHTPEQLAEAGSDGHVPKPVDFFKLTLLLAQTNVRRTLDTLKR